MINGVDQSTDMGHGVREKSGRVVARAATVALIALVAIADVER
jgi:hypothetical protein